MKYIFFFIFIIINVYTSPPSFAEKINCESYFANPKLDFKEISNIKSMEILVHDNKKWHKNFMKIITSKGNMISPDYKKNFPGKLTVVYKDADCIFDIQIRQNGDFKDHVKLFNNNTPLQSVNIEILNNANLLGINSFKLLIPETRFGDNEIFATTFLSKFDILAPRTFNIMVKLNEDKFQQMLFQENPVKEFLEHNNRREGPIFEANEEILWSYRLKNKTDPADRVLIRQTNPKFSLKSEETKRNSLFWFSILQKTYIDYHSIDINSQFQKNNLKTLNPSALSQNSEEAYNKFLIFEILVNAFGSDHGLIYHNRKFFANDFEESIEPIYYDGMTTFLTNREIATKSFVEQKNNWEILHSLFKDEVHKIYLKSFIISKLNDEFEKNLHEHLIKKNVKISKVEFNNVFNNFKNNLIKFFEYKSNETNLYKLNYPSTLYEQKLFDKYDDLLTIKKIKNSSKEEYNLCQKFNSCVPITIKANDLAKLISGKYSLDKTKQIIFISDIHLNSRSKIQRVTIFDKEGKKINIIKTEGMTHSFNNQTNELSFSQNSYNDWVLIRNSSLENLKIILKNIKPTKKIEPKIVRPNDHNITGCLNIYDSNLLEVSIVIENTLCEDALNIIRSSGSINYLSIINSYSDASDLDFSNLTINEAQIDIAGNDCIDFSGGIYMLKNSKLSNCSDKGISVGENSLLNADNININFSSIGISSKDSSKVYIKNSKFEHTKICLEAAKKKQEFNGGFIEIENLNCGSNPFTRDEFSLIKKR
jgi:hypothetical protein